jgi:hypothetical protein
VWHTDLITGKYEAKCSVKTLSQGHLVHHTFRIDCPGLTFDMRVHKERIVSCTVVTELPCLLINILVVLLHSRYSKMKTQFVSELFVSLDDSMDGCGTSYSISVTGRVRPSKV